MLSNKSKTLAVLEVPVKKLKVIFFFTLTAEHPCEFSQCGLMVWNCFPAIITTICSATVLKHFGHYR